jgi:flagellar biosynthesis/type III secretory pathway chaperone
LVTKKKEKLMADLKKLETQQRKLEEEINVKDSEL